MKPGLKITRLKIKFFRKIILSGLILLMAIPTGTPAWDDCRSLPGIKPILGPNDAVVLAGPDGHLLCAWNPDKPLVPASILKLLTALTVFDQLGPDFRFQTDFMLNADNDLVIKGYGDPLLISEAVAQASFQVSRKVKRVADLLLDGSYFQEGIRIPGTAGSTQPYDAPNGALCVNFNTVNFETINGRLVSAEPQTPLLPLAIEKIRRQKLARGRITFSNNARDALIYAGQLFAFFLARQGVEIQGRIKPSRSKSGSAIHLLTFRSPFTLRQVVARLMAYSNNFIANQVLLAAGADAFGPPATLDKAVRLLERYARQACGLEDIKLVEGSGISLRNRISARSMLKVLERFMPYHRLLRYDPLRKRFYKTGTLKGVRTRAGFIRNDRLGLHPYVIMGRRPSQVDKIEAVLSQFVTHQP